MVNVIMELIDRFIEFILQRLPDEATENEKSRYVMRMMVISFSVLFWGLIAITTANIDLKRDNYVLNKTVGKVNTLLDVNNPTNPLNSLLLLNNESLVKLHKVSQENSALSLENLRLELLSKQLQHELLEEEGISNNLRTQLNACKDTPVIKNSKIEKPPIDDLPDDPNHAKYHRPIAAIKEDDPITDESKKH